MVVLPYPLHHDWSLNFPADETWLWSRNKDTLPLAISKINIKIFLLFVLMTKS